MVCDIRSSISTNDMINAFQFFFIIIWIASYQVNLPLHLLCITFLLWVYIKWLHLCKMNSKYFNGSNNRATCNKRNNETTIMQLLRLRNKSLVGHQSPTRKYTTEYFAILLIQNNSTGCALKQYLHRYLSIVAICLSI